jgi:hypothetical protein
MSDNGMAAVFVVLGEHVGWEADAGRGADAACEDGCLRGEGHDGPCIDADDVAEGKLRARDYDGWAAL